MKCPNCGTTSRIREKDNFCYKCGCNLELHRINKVKNDVLKVLKDNQAAQNEKQEVNILLDKTEILRAKCEDLKDEVKKSKALEQLQKKIDIADEVDESIKAVCQLIKQGVDFVPGECAETVKALGILVEARAKLI